MDIEIRIISYALTAIFVTESCGRDLLFISPHRLDEGHLFGILLDEDECSAVKEQVTASALSDLRFDRSTFRCAMS